MIQSDNITELLVALEAVQSELPTMPKNTPAYGYKYADLDSITQAIKPILHKHGIAYLQTIGGASQEQMTLTTRVFNTKGQYVEDTAFLPVITGTKNNAAQTLGMSITYMRRYALCAMLGITSDEDVDANVEAKPQPPKQSAPPKKQVNSADVEKIKTLLDAKHPNGTPVFSEDEKNRSRAAFANGRALSEIIKELQKTLDARLAIPSVTPRDNAGADAAFDKSQEEMIF